MHATRRKRNFIRDRLDLPEWILFLFHVADIPSTVNGGWLNDPRICGDFAVDDGGHVSCARRFCSRVAILRPRNNNGSCTVDPLFVARTAVAVRQSPRKRKGRVGWVTTRLPTKCDYPNF